MQISLNKQFRRHFTVISNQNLISLIAHDQISRMAKRNWFEIKLIVYKKIFGRNSYFPGRDAKIIMLLRFEQRAYLNKTYYPL